MKKIILFLMLLGFGIQSNFATSNENIHEIRNPSIEFTQSIRNTEQSILFEYESFNDFQTFDFGILDQLFNDTEEDCMVTATVTVSHTGIMEGNVGVAKTGHNTTVSISASVTASCSEISSAVKRLIAELKASLGL